jgi:Ca-activated chloride channel family protein
MTMGLSRTQPLLDETLPNLANDSEPGREAGIGALETARGRLPLVALDVTGRIDGLLSQVTVRQTFVNSTDEALEATYVFPLPDRAGVTGFRMTVAGRVVEGVLRERGQARREYAEALRHGHRSSIAEEERPGAFTLRVGNLMPGDVADVELTMAGVLPYEGGEVTFRFPLVVAPRYIPGVPLPGPSVGGGTAVDTGAVPDASRISPPVLLPGFPNPVRLSMAIDVYESASPVENLRVSLFTVWGEVRGEVRRLIVQPGERLDRDFILRFRLGGDSVRTSLSLHPDESATGEGTFALCVVPPLGGETAPRPRDAVFVLDRSGSMAGWKMVAARRAMGRMIDTLTEKDRFAVLAFDDRIEAPGWSGRGKVERLIHASDRNRFGAVEFLAKLEARGGTEIARPLDEAVGLLAEPAAKGAVERERILFLVTDGQVGNEDQVLSMLGARLSRVRVLMLGIDRAVNAGFLNRLAQLGSGGSSSELVESEDRLDAVLESVHRRIGTPIVTDLDLVAGANGFSVVADSLVPDRPPSLFAGSPLLILGRYRGCAEGRVEVRGKIARGGEWRQAVVAGVRENPAITAAWARGHLRQLEDGYAAGLSDRSDLERRIVATSLHFGVLCRFTAFVAVDRAAVVNEGGEVHMITQPVEMPAGWGEQVDSLAAHCLSAPRSAVLHDTLAFATAETCGHPSLAGRIHKFSARFMRSGVSRTPIFSAPPQPEWCSPPLPPSVPERLVREAEFTLLSEFEQDEHGTVYKASDKGGRLVSVRVLTHPVKVAGRAAFLRLEKKMKRLKHPAVAAILGLIADPGAGLVIAVVSEYVGGATLLWWLSQSGAPDPRKAARLVVAVAGALEYGRRQGIFHGNVRGDTIRIGDDGEPRLMGLGLARLDCGPVRSTALERAQVAPELLAGQIARPTARSDVYSLGVVFYWLLTGGLPGGEPGEEGPRTPRAINPRVPADLEAICMKAMATEPAMRYATAGELASALCKTLGMKRAGLLGRLTGGREDFWK